MHFPMINDTIFNKCCNLMIERLIETMVWKVLLIILIILILLLVGMYFLGRKLQKKQAEQQAQIEAAKQSVSMLIIDKKKMKLRDAGLPAAVLEQAPKYMRRAKLDRKSVV